MATGVTPSQPPPCQGEESIPEACQPEQQSPPLARGGSGWGPVFTHPDFYLFNKPHDVSFHSESGTGFFAALQQQFPDETLFPVHRLDRMTSGLVLVARHREAAQQLGKLFEAGKVDKTYLALSDHKPGKKQGLIAGDMQKSRSGNWKLLRTREHPAITRFTSQPTDRVFNEKPLRLFILKPQTGKTHQLRVMMKAISAPVLGDERYGGTPADRGYLHAYRLQFDWKGEAVFCTLPPDGGCFAGVADEVM